MDLTSYAALAVLLINSPERLNDLAGVTSLLAEAGHEPHGRKVTRTDLEALRDLREELIAIFEAAEEGREHDAIDRVNSLLILHPVHPQISGHDGQPWHLHLTEGGRLADQYAVGAVMGLAALVTDFGLDRLGLCQAAPCRRAYLDTSSNRSRRYCSERCASRANVAAYRARKRKVPVAG
ncbi:CGNR zinc finger domain-containing protein [Thermostaphylospora chromogena]|uniref:Putative stress-induced transcription regulator n=1 Tax=Thermostaphylospora chromogena TaxID=35622 RepID=A0A1H1APD8_9ACTN|nr:CGNR zinc finger domain-containing protein [Thermostaphylospora chromogena]SDQ41036.1 Putative stress-induced transcription regulator [Thermostaphylospora chromogena]